MNESDDESSGGIWLVVSFLAVCAIAALAIPLLPVRTHSSQNACINNLRQMDGAVQQWALEQKKNPNEKVMFTDIAPYLKNSITCPQGGKYTVGPAVSNVPCCSITAHHLPP